MSVIISIFGSGLAAPGSDEYDRAYRLGRELAKHGFTVCNGGYGGVMEASAKGASEEGGHTIGVTIPQLASMPNPFIREYKETPSLLARLERLLGLASGYVIMPGGTGTLVELALSWELQRKGLVPAPKPIVLVGNHWLPAIRSAGKEDMPSVKQLSGTEPALPAHYLHVVDTPEEAASLLSRLLLHSQDMS